MRWFFAALFVAGAASACHFDKDRQMEESQSKASKQPSEIKPANEEAEREGWAQRETSKLDNDRADHKVLELDQEIRELSAALDQQTGTDARCGQVVAELRPHLLRVQQKIDELKKLNASSEISER